MSNSRGEILNLIYTYGELLDGADIDGLADLLADAVITSQAGQDVSDDRAGVYRGRDEIYAFFGGAGAKSVIQNFLHVAANTIVDIDEEAGTAKARSYYLVVHPEPDGRLGIMVAGKYLDQFVRTDGHWRFAARTYAGNLSSESFRAFRE